MPLHHRSKASCAARRAFQLSTQDKEVSVAPRQHLSSYREFPGLL